MSGDQSSTTAVEAETTTTTDFSSARDVSDPAVCGTGVGATSNLADNSNSADDGSSNSTIETTGAVVPFADTTIPLSKNQLKKKRRWEKLMDIKKRRKLQDKQVKLELAKVQGRDICAERAQQEAARILGENRKAKRIEWERTQLPRMAQSFAVCLDCCFERDMSAKEINSLALQIRYCYSLNKRNAYPCPLTMTSIDTASHTLQHLQNVSGFDEWTNWGLTATSTSLEEHYADRLANVVYLTSDAETVLQVLEPTKIYVIGGIVDRNRLKRATYNRAVALGVATARLPIDEHLHAMAATKVLTVNHVFELLLQYRQHKGDWKAALQEVLPSRKEAKFNIEDDNMAHSKDSCTDDATASLAGS
jgi:tRNA (guanine9-N1)-methyltransferase